MFYYAITQVTRTKEAIKASEEKWSMQMTADSLELGIDVNDFAGFTVYENNILVFQKKDGNYCIVRAEDSKRINVKSGVFQSWTDVEAYIKQKIGWF